MLRFNLALVPQDERLQSFFKSLAQEHLSAHHDGYILGHEALAHVTLCQFLAESKAVALETFRSFKAKENSLLRLEPFRIRPGGSEHAGFFWCEFPIERKKALMEMQEKCFQHLSSRNLEVRISHKGYAPHITLARIRNALEDFNFHEDIPYETDLAFRPVVGCSTEIGVLTREL